MPLLERHRIVLPAVWLIAAAWMLAGYDRGWIEHDAGTLGQIAERTLRGELPHRDFGDPYTGGLSYLLAAACGLWGTSLHSLRVMLLLWTLAFVPAVYGIASRAAPAWVCGLVTLACLVWSVPNYCEAMPSWFNLFCAAFGTLALLRHVETDRLRWGFLAGICGGVSFLFKSAGLYFVAAGLLFLVYREQELARAQGAHGPNRGYGPFVAAGLGGFLFALAHLVGSLDERVAGVMPVLHFALPGFACAGTLLWNEWGLRELAGAPRWARLMRLGLPFVAGALVPVAVYLVPYALSGSVDDWLHGVFVAPLARLSVSTYPLPPLSTIWTALPLAALLAFPAGRARSRSAVDGSGDGGIDLPDETDSRPGGDPLRDLQMAAAFLLAAIAAGIVLFGSAAPVYAGVWNSMRNAPPLVVLAGCALSLARSRGAGADAPAARQEVFLLTAMAALVPLVQIPQAWGIYFCYAAPMVLLAALFVVMAQPCAPRKAYLLLAAFYLAFAATWMNRNDIRHLPDRFRPEAEYVRLDLPRGGIRVPRRHAEMYSELAEVVRRHSPEGSAIYAMPDVPQVYFLTGRTNPTGTLFDLFDADWPQPRERAARIARTLEEREVRLAVISMRAEFSPIPRRIVELLRARFPNAVEIELRADGSGGARSAPAFEVRW